MFGGQYGLVLVEAVGLVVGFLVTVVVGFTDGFVVADGFVIGLGDGFAVAEGFAVAVGRLVVPVETLGLLTALVAVGFGEAVVWL